MRSLQECQAEVFRRSEKRIRVRRRRIRTLMACVPLALCIAAFSVFFPAATKNGDPADGHPPESNEPSALYADVCRIDVSRAGHVTSITGEERIRAIADVLAESDSSYNADLPGGSDAAEIESCTITLIAEEGLRGVYRLTEDVLTNQNTGRTAALTRAQAEALWALLQPENAED